MRKNKENKKENREEITEKMENEIVKKIGKISDKKIRKKIKSCPLDIPDCRVLHFLALWTIIMSQPDAQGVQDCCRNMYLPVSQYDKSVKPKMLL